MINNLNVYRGEQAILQDFNLVLKRGEFLCLSGKSGQGKSTLLKAILKTVDVESGEIWLEGQKVNQMSHSVLYDKIAYCPQSSMVFQDTVFANVTRGNASSSDHTDIANYRRSMKMAGLGHWLIDDPDGSFVILEGGKNISGGEKRRLCIARALFHPAKIKLFDEATTGLDLPAIKEILETITQLGPDFSCLFVSHDPHVQQISHRHERLVA